VFGDKTTQSKLYDEAIQPVVREVLAGFNCTIFAYGQTGTGAQCPCRMLLKFSRSSFAPRHVCEVCVRLAAR
jgi:Kinesin motor domain